MCLLQSIVRVAIVTEQKIGSFSKLGYYFVCVKYDFIFKMWFFSFQKIICDVSKNSEKASDGDFEYDPYAHLKLKPEKSIPGIKPQTTNNIKHVPRPNNRFGLIRNINMTTTQDIHSAKQNGNSSQNL